MRADSRKTFKIKVVDERVKFNHQLELLKNTEPNERYDFSTETGQNCNFVCIFYKF